MKSLLQACNAKRQNFNKKATHWICNYFKGFKNIAMWTLITEFNGSISGWFGISEMFEVGEQVLISGSPI